MLLCQGDSSLQTWHTCHVLLRLALAAGSRSADDGKEHEERLVTVLILLPEIKAFPPEAKFLFTMINYATYLLIDFLAGGLKVM